MVHTGVADISPGGSSEAAPPVPIPNTVVKRFSAYDTALATEWENRSPPGGISSASPLIAAPSQSTAPVAPTDGSSMSLSGDIPAYHGDHIPVGHIN